LIFFVGQKAHRGTKALAWKFTIYYGGEAFEIFFCIFNTQIILFLTAETLQ